MMITSGQASELFFILCAILVTAAMISYAIGIIVGEARALDRQEQDDDSEPFLPPEPADTIPFSRRAITTTGNRPGPFMRGQDYPYQMISTRPGGHLRPEHLTQAMGDTWRGPRHALIRPYTRPAPGQDERATDFIARITNQTTDFIARIGKP